MPEIYRAEKLNFNILPKLYNPFAMLEDKPLFFDENFKELLNNLFQDFANYAEELEIIKFIKIMNIMILLNLK